MIAIIDYDIGNLGAVSNMLGRIGAHAIITADPEVVAKADKIVLPGNGAFDSCMRGLRASGLVPLLEQRVLGDHVPLLGICVGAQMLGNGSEEGVELGLGWLPMQVKRFPAELGLRVPQMGWNSVVPRQPNHILLEGMRPDARFYFVHSFFMEPINPEDVLLETTYGLPIAAAVGRGHIAGLQFHPEKSHKFGLHLLGRFATAF